VLKLLVEIIIKTLTLSIQVNFQKTDFSFYKML